MMSLSSEAANLEDLLKEAGDPTTAPERLRGLFVPDQFEAVLRALAGNPNTPPEVLVRLAETHPHEFLHNPVLPLLCLEDPNFVKQIPQETALHLLRMEDVPMWLLEQFLSGPKLVARAAKLHVGLAGEAGDEWPLEVEAAIKVNLDTATARAAKGAKASRFRGGLSPEVIPTLPSWLVEAVTLGVVESGHPLWSRVLANSTEAARTAARRMRRAGAGNDLMDLIPPDLSMPVAELEILAKGGWLARMLAARHPNTPPEILLELAQEGLPVEENPNAPASILQLLADDEDSRYGVARHPHTEEETLRRMADDKQNKVRIAVARHPHTPTDVLARFATDGNSFVRGGVARNPAASPELLARLATDSHAAVRFDVARHPQAPLEALSLLALDEDGEILDALLRRIDLPGELRSQMTIHRATVKKRLTWLSKKQLIRRAHNGSLLREELSRMNHQVSRLRAARSAKTPVDVLQKLGRDNSPIVRAGVAENRNTPPKILASLARDKDPDVCEFVATNPHTPLKELRRLSNSGFLKEGIPETVALNRALSPELAEHLAAKKSPAIDVNLVRNPATPSHVLHILAARMESLEDLTPILRHHNADVALKAQVQQRLRQGVLYTALCFARGLFGMVELSTPQTSPDKLMTAASSTLWLNRLAVARHPSTPLEVLCTLQRDGNRVVRAAARAALQEHGPREDENL